MLRRRQAQPQGDAEAASLAIQDALLGLEAVARAADVLVYLAVRGEVDTRRLIQGLWDKGSRVLVPRCRPDAPGELDLHCLRCFSELRPGAYGIPEPDPEHCPALDDAESASPQVVVVPGVAFDRHGRRLGYGGGYYDRLLARPGLCRALRVAPAYSLQVVNALPADPWDVPVHLLVTEREVIEAAPCASTPA